MKALFLLQAGIIIFHLIQLLPIKNYTKEQRNFLLYGITFPDFVKAHKDIKAPKKVSEGNFEGIIPHLLNLYKKNPEKASNDVKKYIVHEPCTECNNSRLARLGKRSNGRWKNYY